MEQLNIEGKRSGEGFICHRERLVGALSRAQASRVRIGDIELGRKGFLGYIRFLSGGMVKIIPSNDGASEAQAISKGLKVVCGSNTSHLADGAWITNKTGYDTCEVRVSPNVSVIPNLGGIELAEALGRVAPFTAGKSDERPVLKCVRFAQKEGKLTLTAADGFRLADVSLDFGDGEGNALIPANEIKGLISALKKAKRVRLAFEPNGIADHNNLVVETEAITYRWKSEVGTFPDYEKLFPADGEVEARFDTRELLRAGMAVASLADVKDTTIRLYIGESQVRVSYNDGAGEATVEAQTEGEAKTALSAKYLTQVLKALGGMAELKLKGPGGPILFTVDGYRVVVMPMFVKWGDETEATTEPVAEAEAEKQAITVVCPNCQAEVANDELTVAENGHILCPMCNEDLTELANKGKVFTEGKPRRNRKAKEPVAVEA